MNANIKRITFIAVLCAIAYVVMVVGRFPLIPSVEFLKYDPKDVIIVIGGFMFGPVAALVITVIVSVIEMLTVSSTWIIGLFMNVVSSAAFACTAAYIYKKNRTMKGAVIGLAAGVLLMTGVMLLWNYILTPVFMSVPRSEVVKMLVPGLLPFNLIKAGINAALTVLLYKPLVRALRASRLMPKSDASTGGGAALGVTLVAAFMLVSLVMIVLIWRGVI